ncbi:hypothetical protein EGI24_13505 [Lacihabitans sp. CS3-21]|nr:hypothetical protein [Lacihabitans sp. CS3-21]
MFKEKIRVNTKNYANYEPMCLKKKYESIQKTMLTMSLCDFKKIQVKRKNYANYVPMCFKKK